MLNRTWCYSQKALDVTFVLYFVQIVPHSKNIQKILISLQGMLCVKIVRIFSIFVPLLGIGPSVWKGTNNMQKTPIPPQTLSLQLIKNRVDLFLYHKFICFYHEYIDWYSSQQKLAHQNLIVCLCILSKYSQFELAGIVTRLFFIKIHSACNLTSTKNIASISNSYRLRTPNQAFEIQNFWAWGDKLGR